MKYVRNEYILIVLCLGLISAAACSGKDNIAEDNIEILQEDSNSISESNVGDISKKEIPEVVEEKEDENKIMKEEVLQEDKTVWTFQTNGGIVASPIINGDVIYFGSKDGNLYAVNKDTGEEVWKYSIGTPILCQPAILDEAIFFSSKEVYIAVNAMTGAELWKYDLQPDIRATFRKDQWDYHDSTPVIDHGIVYFGSGTGAILGFDVASGELKWEFNASGSISMRSTPMIEEGVMYYGDWAGNYRAVEIATKNILWENSYQQAFQSAAAMKDGIIFMGGRDTRIHAIDSKTGESKWDYKDPDGSWITGDPIVDGDIVYFSTSDSEKVYAMSIEDGTVMREYPIYKNSFSKVLIDNGLLYVTSGDAYRSPGSGKLQVYRLNDHENMAWEVSLDNGGVFTSPLLVNNIVYFGSEDGYLYAVRSNETVIECGKVFDR